MSTATTRRRVFAPSFALAFCTFAAMSTIAHAAFIVGILSVNVGTGANAGLTDYVLGAINNGQNSTGNTLNDVDVNIITPGSGTTGALVFDLNADIDNDGTPDTDITGAPDQTFGTATPTFGGPAGFFGTIVGVATQPNGHFAAGSPTGFVDFGAWLGSQTSALRGISGTQANYLSAQGPLDPAFENGTVHAFELVGGFFSTTNKGTLADVNPVPFANIVVPTGTPWSAVGEFAGNIGPVQPFSINSTQVPEPATGALIAIPLAGVAVRRRRR